MRRLLIAALVGLLMLVGVVQATAATIHTHFFESIDVDLSEQQFQVMSVAMLSGEELTVVAYGITDEVLPQVTLLDPLGTTVNEDLNSDANEVAYVQHTVRQAGVFTILVSRQSTQGGMVRVMVFEGEPLEPNATYLDTLDPFAPSRAFMIATDPEDPISMSVELLEPEEEEIVVPEVFASRSDTEKLAPEDERTTAIPEDERVSWLNSEELPFVTLNVRPFPELTAPTSSRIGGWMRPAMQGWVEIFDYLIILGEGGEPERVNRTYCLVDGLEVLGIGPGGQWIVVDPDSEFGIALVPQGDLNVELGSEGCNRVVPMQVHPDLVPVATGGGTGSGTGGLPPAGDPPNPGGDDDDITLPTPPPPTGDDDDPPPATPEVTPEVTPDVTPEPGWSVYSITCETPDGYAVHFSHDLVPVNGWTVEFSISGIVTTDPMYPGDTNTYVWPNYPSDLYPGLNTLDYWKITDETMQVVASGGPTVIDCPVSPGL